MCAIFSSARGDVYNYLYVGRCMLNMENILRLTLLTVSLVFLYNTFYYLKNNGYKLNKNAVINLINFLYIIFILLIILFRVSNIYLFVLMTTVYILSLHINNKRNI